MAASAPRPSPLPVSVVTLDEETPPSYPDAFLYANPVFRPVDASIPVLSTETSGSYASLLRFQNLDHLAEAEDSRGRFQNPPPRYSQPGYVLGGGGMMSIRRDLALKKKQDCLRMLFQILFTWLGFIDVYFSGYYLSASLDQYNAFVRGIPGQSPTVDSINEAWTAMCLDVLPYLITASLFVVAAIGLYRGKHSAINGYHIALLFRIGLLLTQHAGRDFLYCNFMNPALIVIVSSLLMAMEPVNEINAK
ncbi:unnamed protein product, partial [Mesorhabditis spiculigera]